MFCTQPVCVCVHPEVFSIPSWLFVCVCVCASWGIQNPQLIMCVFVHPEVCSMLNWMCVCVCAPWGLLHAQLFVRACVRQYVRASWGFQHAQLIVCISVCVCERVCLQHDQHMCRILLSHVAWPCVPNFSSLPHKRQDFPKKVIEHKLCIGFFSAIPNISHFKKNATRYYHKCTQLFLYNTCYSQILIKIEFPQQIFEKFFTFRFPLKSVRWEPNASMWTDEQTDMTKLTPAFTIFRMCLKMKDNFKTGVLWCSRV
jgi:hypothetical protein